MAKLTFWYNIKKALFNPIAGDNDEEHGNFDSVVAVADLAAQLAGTVNGADQDNPIGAGVEVTVDVTAIGGTTPQVIVTVQGKDPRSGKYYTLLASAALNAVATTTLLVYPGVTATANVSASRPLPRTWRVIAVVSGGAAAAITAKISACVMR